MNLTKIAHNRKGEGYTKILSNRGDNLISTNIAKRGQYASRWGIAALLAGVILAVSLFEGESAIELFGRTSLASFLATIAFIIGLSVTVIAYRSLSEQIDEMSQEEKATQDGDHIWLGRVAVGIVTSTFLVALTGVTLYLISRMVNQATLAPPTAIIIGTIFSGVVGFAVAFWASTVQTGHMLVLTALTAIVGLGLAIINVDDASWIHNSISYLSHEEGSDAIFQVTLMLAGIMLLGVLRDITNNLEAVPEVTERDDVNFGLFSKLLVIIPILLVGVGLFPTTFSAFSTFMHNFCIYSVVLIYLFLMFAVGRLMPIYQNQGFLTWSKIFGVAGVVAIIGWRGLGLYNFTVFEVLIISIISLWTFLLYRATKGYIRRQD